MGTKSKPSAPSPCIQITDASAVPAAGDTTTASSVSVYRVHSLFSACSMRNRSVSSARRCTDALRLSTSRELILDAAEHQSDGAARRAHVVFHGFHEVVDAGHAAKVSETRPAANPAFPSAQGACDPVSRAPRCRHRPAGPGPRRPAGIRSRVQLPQCARRAIRPQSPRATRSRSCPSSAPCG